MARVLLGVLCLGDVVVGGAIHAVRDVTDSSNSTTIATGITTSGDIAKTVRSSSSHTQGHVGDYIMQGLGGSDQSQSLASGMKNGTRTDKTTTVQETLESTSTIVKTVTEDQWQACQSSWVEWSQAWSKTLSATEFGTTSFSLYELAYNFTEGTGDVYTTIDGIPRAHGTFTVTSLGDYVETITETYSSTVTRTVNASFASPTPTCSIPFAPCSELWRSYLNSLGITTPLDKATEPVITPMPTNRPRCSIGDVSWTHSLATWDNRCLIYGDRVKLFYWPDQTSVASSTMPAPSPNITAAPVTAVRGNFTFTSPSVYLSFNTLQAIDGTDIDTAFVSETVPLGATRQSTTLLGGFYPQILGPTFTNKYVSVHPTDISSVIANLGPGVNTASAISELAHGGPDYAKWVKAIEDSQPIPTLNNSYLIRPMNYAHLTKPDLEDYYLRPSAAPGCRNPYGPHPGCSTVFEGAYRAQLLVPDEVRQLAPEWKGCGIPLDGVYDPPQALTAARSEATPVAPPSTTPTSPPGVVTTRAGKSTAEPAKPQETVGDPLPQVTATPAEVPDPKTKPAAQQTPEAVPSQDPVGDPKHSSGAEDTGIQASASRVDDPLASIKPQSTATPDQPENPQVIHDPSSIDPPAPTNALSVLAAAESSQGNPDGPSATQPAQGPHSMAAVFSVADSTIVVPSPDHSTAAITIGTATLSPGGPAVTIDHHQVSVGSQGIVVDSQTVPYATQDPGSGPTSSGVGDPEEGPNAPSSGVAPIMTAGGHTYSFYRSDGIDAAVVDGQTVSLGSAATTISGQEVSMGGNAVVVGSQTMSFADAGTSPSVVDQGSGVFVYGSRTLTAGGADQTVSGQVVSAASSGVVVGGTTLAADTTRSSSLISDTTASTPTARQTTSSSASSSSASATMSQSDASRVSMTIGCCLTALVAVLTFALTL